jgi:predicted MFS family arabinose efflux permease
MARRTGTLGGLPLIQPSIRADDREIQGHTRVAQIDIVDEIESERQVVGVESGPALGRRRRGSLRRLVGEFPRPVWRLTIGNTILWLGRGMVMPYLFIYFNEVAGLPASIVGGGIAVSAVVSSVFVVFGAPQIDRRGAQPVLLVALAGLAVMTLFYPWAITIPTYLVVTMLYFTFDQLYWPAVNSALVPLSDPNRVAEALALLRCSYIAGIGVGSLIGGAMVTGGGLHQYRVMYTVSVGVIVAAIAVIWRGVPVVKPAPHERGDREGSWSELFSDRLYIGTMCLFFFVVLGYSQLQVNVPAFLHKEAGISEGAIGALFTVKMLIVLAIQLPIAARINRGNLGRLLALSSAFFAFGLFAILFTLTVGIAAAVVVFALFTLGEVLFAPISAIIPVRLSPVHMRGRYFAGQSVVWGMAWGFGAFSAGVALDSAWPALLWPILAVVMVGAAVWSARLATESRLAPP